MSRPPLELTIYPHWDDGFGNVYADKDDPLHPVRVDFEVYRKRLTDAELAAEYHANESAAWLMAGRNPGHYDVDQAYKLEDREVTLRRFAKHPHHDQEDH